MGESSFTVVRPNVTCTGWVRQNPAQARNIVLHCIMLGAFVAGALQAFIWWSRPSVPKLAPGDSARVARVEGGGHMITLHYLSARSAWCTRQVAELASTDEASWDGRAMKGYYGLSFNHNGPGLYYGTTDEYVLYRYLPPGVPSGKWEYFIRVRHECAPWGLIHWNYTSPPREIIIP